MGRHVVLFLGSRVFSHDASLTDFALAIVEHSVARVCVVLFARIFGKVLDRVSTHGAMLGPTGGIGQMDHGMAVSVQFTNYTWTFAFAKIPSPTNR